MRFLLLTSTLFIYNVIEQKKLAFISPWRTGLFQQPDEFLQFGLGEMPQELAVQVIERLIQNSKGCHRLVRESDVDNPAILVATQAVDKPCLLQTIDQPSDSRNDGDRAAGNFQDRQRFAFTPQDAQNVVLRTSQAMFAKQSGEANLQTVAGTHDTDGRFLFGRV